jgi:MFS family permease
VAEQPDDRGLAGGPVLTASTRRALTAPRSAAVAGIVFALLLGTGLVLIRLSVPTDFADLESSQLTGATRARILVALTLVPFAGIAFLWFVGVVRDRIGEAEDRFIATVFLGSGLLFLAMLFASTAVAGALVVSTGSGQATLDPQVWALGAHTSSTILNVYAMRMAGVFMISTATISLRTAVMPRWLAFLGYLLAVCLLFGVSSLRWAELLFPTWVLIVSVHLLMVVRRAPRPPREQPPAARRTG